MAAKKRNNKEPTAFENRGRIQAQGGGTEKSVSWRQKTPPTESEMMEMISELESRLTPAQRRARKSGFEQLRDFVRKAAQSGGTPKIKKTYPIPVVHRIRVDLEVITGSAAVPDKEKAK